MNILRSLCTFIVFSTLICAAFGQESSTFFVPDSIISLSSQKEVSFDGKVFGMPLWAELPDSAIKQTNDEWLQNRTNDQNEFGVNRAAWYVQTPSLLIFPSGIDTLHTVVVIFPGGAFQRVVIDKEGIDVAQRLNQSGVSAVVVKYRTDASINYNHVPDSLFNAIYADALQAMKIVREKASQYNFDTNKIGTMGFSAGGALAAKLLVYANTEISDSDPDFCCLTYPVLYDSIRQKVSEHTPPTFLVSTEDDYVSYPYVEEFYDSLNVNGVEAELQVFSSGGHGYGLGVNGGDVTQWPGLFVDWLRRNDILLSVDHNAGYKFQPNDFKLYHCYPNPFNPQTIIGFRLNRRQNILLTIYDNVGREIQTLVQQPYPAGEHKIIWNALNEASGIYYARLMAGGKAKIIKLIYIK